jgi:hypothetical protein
MQLGVSFLRGNETSEASLVIDVVHFRATARMRWFKLISRSPGGPGNDLGFVRIVPAQVIRCSRVGECWLSGAVQCDAGKALGQCAEPEREPQLHWLSADPFVSHFGCVKSRYTAMIGLIGVSRAW